MDKTNKLFWIVTFILVNAFLLAGCGSTTRRTTVTDSEELDIAIREASDYLNDNIPAQSIIVILNVQSESAALSNYIIDELIANAVNDRNFTVVDRQQLESIRVEQNFQLSGEVDDRLALEIGRFFGAQTIVSGTISSLGNRYRMTVRALEVQTARVQGQFNKNLSAWETITVLMRDGGGIAQGGTVMGRAARGSTAQETGSIISEASTNAEQAFNNVRRNFDYPRTFNWNDGVSRLNHTGINFYEEPFSRRKLDTLLDYWDSLPNNGTYYSETFEPYRIDRNADENLRLVLQLRYDRDDNRFLQLEIQYSINGKFANYQMYEILPEKVLEIVRAMVNRAHSVN